MGKRKIPIHTYAAGAARSKGCAVVSLNIYAWWVVHTRSTGRWVGPKAITGL